MSDEYIAHDLFRINIRLFVKKIMDQVRLYRSNLGADPTPWEWFEKGGFEQFLYDIQSNANSGSRTVDTYTRANYVKFSRMMSFIHAYLPNLLPVLPEWSYLVTELHCRVLERELLTAEYTDHDVVHDKLKNLLCRLATWTY